MLMDEPFGATDPITREKLQAEFLRLQAELGKTIIFVTHDFEEAIRLGDRIAVMSERSQIEQFDTPANILAAPANDYVASFIGQGAAIKRLTLIPVTQMRLMAHRPRRERRRHPQTRLARCARPPRADRQPRRSMSWTRTERRWALSTTPQSPMCLVRELSLR